ncbi:MAG: alpha-rhamnosidase [Chitinophagaceae bacterium]|nr:MAG: alpha-rhamnosidase [Chitinophagaceae bacterium]
MSRLPCRFLASIVLSAFATTLHAQTSGFHPIALKTEYLITPLGIDAPNPRFTWMTSDSRAGAKQTAFQVFVGTDSAAVSNGNATQLSTEKQTGAQQLYTYNGKKLEPFTRYYLYVRTWDKDGQPASAMSWFETGMMNPSNWTGTWISDNQDPKLKPAPYFRKQINLGKNIRSARAYIAAAGLYELSVNGSKTGDHRLDPMYTRFDRRNLYVTYDVTSQLKQGANTIGVVLGNGWYNHQSTAVWYFDKAPWRNRPAFCLDLRVTYEDGTVETFKSGRDWKTHLGPIIFNSIYTAEHYDARKELPGWNTSIFNDSAWKAAIPRSAPSGNIVAQAMHPVRNVETLPAVSVKKLNDTVYVFDIGRNISGVSSFKVSAPAGTIFRLKHGERLYPDGHVDISNIDAHYRPTDNTDPFQTDIFIAGGKPGESFMPRFNYKGFQYVEVISSAPVTLGKENLTAYFMHSDVPAAGTVQSSNPVINRIWSATNASYLSNLFGYPTDCPQREKNGWTGDAQIAIETGLYGFDGITIYEKWLADHRDEQQPNGVLPSIIPTDGWGYEWGNGPDWTSTIAIIPWNVYLFYGDSKLLADCYENIRRYVDHIDQEYPSGLTTWGLGDWIPVKSQSPVELTSTAYYYADANILAKAARLFGNEPDAKRYSELAAKIKKAFNDKYLNAAANSYGSGLQTELSVALFWGLVPDELKPAVAKTLADRVAADGYKLDVGLLGTKAILNALSENGYADIAYRLAANEKYPSWGWWIVNGATTLYENWPIDAKSDISMNHIMFGEIGAWLYKAPGGIRPDPAAPGFRNVVLEPQFVTGLESFSSTHDGPFGTISSAWKRSKKSISYSVTVPANSTALVKLALAKGQKVFLDGKQLPATGPAFSYKLSSGTFAFEIK